MNLDEMLKQSTEELATAEDELRAAQQRVDELRTIQEGVRLAKQRYGQDDQTSTPTSSGRTTKVGSSSTRRPRRKPPAKRSQPQVNQSDLCLQMLVQLDRPASSAEIRDRLEAQGHNLTAEQVRAAFAYLLRKGEVTRVDAGVWGLPPRKDDEVPAGRFSVVGELTANG